MRPGPHKKPEQFVREPWWRAVLWEVLLRVGGMLGLMIGAVGGFYLCRMIDAGDGRHQKQQFLFWIGFAGLGWIFGGMVANALVRRLRGASGQESLEPSGESDSGIGSPPE